MRNLLILAFVLTLGACQGSTEQPIALSPSLECPRLDPASGYWTSPTQGPDYTICFLGRGDAPEAELRLGGTWSFKGRAGFAGFSHTEAGAIAWIVSSDPLYKWQQTALIPTTSINAMQLVIYEGPSHRGMERRERLLRLVIGAYLHPNNSFKPKPLRGSA